MSGKLNVYGLGSQGVNVDKNPVQLEDGELTKAQNAIHDPAGSMGGLRKRKGLVKVNSGAAAGSILGAVGVPIAVGTANNESPAVGPDTREYLMARRASATTAGWNTSSDEWVTSVTTGGPDGYDASATPRVPDNLWPGMIHSGDTTGRYRALLSGRPGVIYRNRYYYAGNDYTYQSTAPTIRMWDGTRDYFIARVPKRGTTMPEAIIDMIVGGNDMIYFTLFDTGVYQSNTMKSRIFQLDPENGVITQLGSDFPISPETVRVPFSLAWHANRVWAKTHGAGVTGGSQRVYFFRPGIDSDWTSDTASESLNSSFQISFQGQLFLCNMADTSAAATITVRSSVGAYSTSHTAALTQAGVTTMGSFGFLNGFTCGAQFGGNLYIAYWNQRGASGANGEKFARIYKFDGTTWSAVFGPAADHADCVPYNQAVVIGGRLYFVSAPAWDTADTVNRMQYTTNGTSFTAITSTLLDDVSGGILGAISS